MRLHKKGIGSILYYFVLAGFFLALLLFASNQFGAISQTQTEYIGEIDLALHSAFLEIQEAEINVKQAAHLAVDNAAWKLFSQDQEACGQVSRNQVWLTPTCKHNPSQLFNQLLDEEFAQAILRVNLESTTLARDYLLHAQGSTLSGGALEPTSAAIRDSENFGTYSEYLDFSLDMSFDLSEADRLLTLGEGLLTSCDDRSCLDNELFTTCFEQEESTLRSFEVALASCRDASLPDCRCALPTTTHRLRLGTSGTLSVVDAQLESVFLGFSPAYTNQAGEIARDAIIYIENNQVQIEIEGEIVDEFTLAGIWKRLDAQGSELIVVAEGRELEQFDHIRRCEQSYLVCEEGESLLYPVINSAVTPFKPVYQFALTLPSSRQPPPSLS